MDGNEFKIVMNILGQGIDQKRTFFRLRFYKEMLDGRPRAARESASFLQKSVLWE